MTQASGPDLWDIIKQLRFNSPNQDGNLVAFNTLADGIPAYDIFNYQTGVNGGPFEFVKVNISIFMSY